MITGKTIALTIWTFGSRVMSLLSTHCLASFPRSEHLLISVVPVYIFQTQRVRVIKLEYMSEKIQIYVLKQKESVNKVKNISKRIFI